MSKETVAALILLVYYALVVSFGFLCTGPRRAFYISVILGLSVCALMVLMGIYLEMAGLLHTLPFTPIAWIISRTRRLNSKRQP